MFSHIKMKIRSDSLSLQLMTRTMTSPTNVKALFFLKAVFHRKKVVQLSLNNHCHAILKNIFFAFRLE